MRIFLMAATAVTLIAGAAFAQPAPPAPPAPPAMQMGMQHQGMGAMHNPAKMADHIRTVLQLRPDQEPALQALVGAMKPPAGHEAMGMGDRMKHEHEAMMSKSTPEKLDMMLARAREHVGMMEAHVAALKTFYAALTPAQQKAFDSLAMAHMHKMHGMMGGMMGHRMGGPEGPKGHPGE